MKYLVSLAFLLAGSGAVSSPPPGCQQFRTGTFRYRFRHALYSTSFVVTRQGNTQTETDQRTGAVTKLAVSWVDECTYQLRLLETTEHFPKEIEEYRRSAPLTTTILKWTDRYYIFRSQRRASDPLLTDTIWLAQ